MKNKIILYICVGIFGVLGAYLTFFRGNTDKFDSETTAYRIDMNERIDSDSTVYYPTYHFRVNGIEYKCETKGGSSKVPKESENKVYYDSTNPNECKTEYEKGTSRFAGIICLIVFAVMVFFIIKNPSIGEETTSTREYENKEIDEETKEKMMAVVSKVSIIYKRIILGIIIAILMFLILLDTAIFKQTIKARNYIETTATYQEKKEIQESEIFDDYIYSFKDKNGVIREITVGFSKDEEPDNMLIIKYDENNPEEFYKQGEMLDKTGIIWYIVKIVAVILLLILFFNKKLLSKIGISMN